MLLKWVLVLEIGDWSPWLIVGMMSGVRLSVQAWKGLQGMLIRWKVHVWFFFFRKVYDLKWRSVV